MIFHNFLNDAFLPVGSNIFLAGTGSSIKYSMEKILEFIFQKKPIIIGLNGYFYGILQLRKESFLNSSQLDLLIPHILITNYTRQGESRYPDGRQKKSRIIRRDPKSSPVLTEKENSSLFSSHILKQKQHIIENGIYIICFNNIDCEEKTIYMGNLDNWNYDKYKKINLLPIKEFSKISLSSIKIKNLSNLYTSCGIMFRPMHLGEFVLSWIHYNKINSLAICGIADNYKTKGKTIPWFWCNFSEKHLGKFKKSMIASQIILRMCQKEYMSNFINLNFNENLYSH